MNEQIDIDKGSSFIDVFAFDFVSHAERLHPQRWNVRGRLIWRGVCNRFLVGKLYIAIFVSQVQRVPLTASSFRLPATAA